MAAKKRSRGPKVVNYVLKVNVQTGQVLRAHVEHPITGERVELKGKAVPQVIFGPGHGIAPVILGSVSPRPIAPTSLMRVPMPDPPPSWLKDIIKSNTRK